MSGQDQRYTPFQRGFIYGNYFGLPIFCFVIGVLAAQGRLHPLVAVFMALASGIVLCSGAMALMHRGGK